MRQYLKVEFDPGAKQYIYFSNAFKVSVGDQVVVNVHGKPYIVTVREVLDDRPLEAASINIKSITGKVVRHYELDHPPVPEIPRTKESPIKDFILLLAGGFAMMFSLNAIEFFKPYITSLFHYIVK